MQASLPVYMCHVYSTIKIKALLFTVALFSMVSEVHKNHVKGKTVLKLMMNPISKIEKKLQHI